MVIQWIVPTTKAAHSIAPSQIFQLNPNKDAATQQARFAEVRRILARDNDPNADCIAVAYAGMPAGLAADLTCPVFRADVQNLARQLAQHPTTDARPHFGHGWIQPITRYEVDEVGLDFIALLYGPAAPAPTPSQEDDMPTPPRKYKPELWRAGPSGAPIREQASTAAPIIDTIAASSIVFTVGESIDGLWRDAIVGDPERLWFVRRRNLTALAPGGDPALYDGIAAVVNARAEGKPIPSGGLSADEIQRIQKAAADVGFILGRDAAVAAGSAVTP